jgi:chromosomal replication initiation ATPase DnaA
MDRALPSQIPLPFATIPIFAKENFIVSRSNEVAVAFIEAWPNWSVSAMVLHGPAGSGKSHLTQVWASKCAAQVVSAAALSGSAFAQLDRLRPVVIEDVDASLANPARDAAIFHLLESATAATPLLLSGREVPTLWPVMLPDLRSRFAALVSLPLGEADEDLLRRLAAKLFADRQLIVPHAIISQLLATLERTPAAVHKFVQRLDEQALAEKRPITAALVRDLVRFLENGHS